MKIKGHSIIELKNVNTGEIERYEDDNMVTNARDYFLQDLGFLNLSPIFNDTLRNNPITTLMGGLLLFDDTITENADTVICPSGLNMIGNGSYNVVADGADGVTELGSWNSTESGWMSDGSYKMVWDFATTQANGTIASACLTSANHGYIGEGNATSEARKNYNALRSDLNLQGTPQTYNVDMENNNIITRIVGISRTNSTITYIPYYNLNYDASHASEHMSTTGKIKLVTRSIPIGELDIRMSVPCNNNGGEAYIDNVSVTEVTVPASFKTQLGNASPWYANKNGSNYYLLASTLHGLASGGVVQGMRINANGTVTSFTVTNTESDTMYCMQANGWDVAFGGDNMVAIINQNSTYKAFFQDITNNADSDIVDIPSVGFVSGHMSMKYDSYCCKAGFKFDYASRTAVPINSTDNIAFNTPVMTDNPLVQVYVPYDNGYWQPYTLLLRKSTNYLATINNLQTPVTKTAEKTMKVTYVLRFS